MKIVNIILKEAIEQLLEVLENTGGEKDLDRIFKKLYQIDEAKKYKATPADYAPVADKIVDMLNDAMQLPLFNWFTNFGRPFVGCEIHFCESRSENDYNFGFTLRFDALKSFNTVKIWIYTVWDPKKLLSGLKNVDDITVVHDVSINNFFESTVGEWTLCKFNNIPANAVVIQRSASGSVQFVMPGDPDTVYRLSDHWGSGIGQCNWYLEGFQRCNSFVFRSENNSKMFCAKIKLENLVVI